MASQNGNTPRLIGLGKRFDDAGIELPRLVNGIAWPVEYGTELYRAIAATKAAIVDSLNDKVTWVPEEDWHVMLFPGVPDEWRDDGLWPDYIPRDSTLGECSRLFLDKVSEMEFKALYSFSFRGMAWGKKWVRFRIKPEGKQEEQALGNLRRAIACQSGIALIDDERPCYEVTIGYLGQMDEEDKRAVAFSAVPLLSSFGAFILDAPKFVQFRPLAGPDACDE